MHVICLKLNKYKMPFENGDHSSTSPQASSANI